MRVSIEKGYHSPIQKLMGQLQTDDPKLAVHHIIGCWIAANGCPGHAIALTPNITVQQPAPSTDSEFADLTDWS